MSDASFPPHVVPLVGLPAALPSCQDSGSDAFYGSLDEPYVLGIDATAIREISSSADDDDDDWWSIQGFKIGRKPTKPGVYIHHGKKVMIKRVK